MQSILKGFEDVPPSFEVLSELAVLLSSPYADLGSVEALVRLDPGLASAVVRLANCAYFGCREPVVSVSEAVERIGLAELTKLVGMMARRTLFQYPLTCYALDAEEAWQQSLGAAVVLEYLACHADEEAGTAYLTGLLHSIGKYPIARLMLRVKPSGIAPKDVDIVGLARWERDMVGVDHLRVGADLLKQWRFAPCIYEPIGHYMHPFLATKYGKMAALLHIAVRLVPSVLNTDVVDVQLPPIAAGVFELAGLDAAAVRDCVMPARAWFKATGTLAQELAS